VARDPQIAYVTLELSSQLKERLSGIKPAHLSLRRFIVCLLAKCMTHSAEEWITELSKVTQLSAARPCQNLPK
jgi:hypothetical protein